MRSILSLLAIALLAACAQSEPEPVTTSVDVNETQLEALFAAIDGLTDDSLDAAPLMELAATTPMDDELQTRFTVRYQGAESEVLYHVWREQVDWVHLYFSSTSEDLIDAIEAASGPFARAEDG